MEKKTFQYCIRGIKNANELGVKPYFITFLMIKPFIRSGYVHKKEIISLISERACISKQSAYRHLRNLIELNFITPTTNGYSLASYTSLWGVLKLNLRISKATSFKKERLRCKFDKKLKVNKVSQSYYNRVTQLNFDESIYKSREKFETHLYYVELVAKYRQGVNREMSKFQNKINYRKTKILDKYNDIIKTNKDDKRLAASVTTKICKKDVDIVSNLLKEKESFKRAYMLTKDQLALTSCKLGTVKAALIFGGKTAMFASLVFKKLEKHGYIKRNKSKKEKISKNKIKLKEFKNNIDKFGEKCFWYFGYVYRQVSSLIKFNYSPFASYTDHRNESNPTFTDFDVFMDRINRAEKLLNRILRKTYQSV